MSTTALGLILLAALAHATWNIAAKSAGSAGAAFVWLYSVASTVLYLPFAVLVLAGADVSMGTWWSAAVVSGIIHTAYFVLLQRGYAVGDVSVVYPLARGTGPLLAVVFAMILFAERPGALGLVGAALVVSGIVVIGLTGSSSSRPGGASRGNGVLFGVMTGVMIAAYTVWDAHAVTALAITPVLLYWGSLVTQVALLTPVALRDVSRLRSILLGNWLKVLAVGVLSPLAYILVLWAMRLAPVSLVAPGRELSVVLVTVAGWLIFREPKPARRLAGAGTVLLGVVLVALF
ncbi:MAG: DMT family transporter [Micrococcaceae bacterium]|nr:DMT family transporter [Micrococcaceae bacterium]